MATKATTVKVPAYLEIDVEIHAESAAVQDEPDAHKIEVSSGPIRTFRIFLEDGTLLGTIDTGDVELPADG